MKTLIITVCLVAMAACSTSPTSSKLPSENEKPIKRVEKQEGDLSKRGGTATVRESHIIESDDASTTDDERNNQPRGHYGTITLQAHNVSSGHAYPLDADVSPDNDGYELKRLYFPKGGWVDFVACDLDEDYSGLCTDENGRTWDIQGE